MNKSNIKFILEDPDRHIHVIEKDAKGQWHGAENIAMHFSEQSARFIARQGVLRAMDSTLDAHGSWGHYTWVRQD